MMMSNPSAIADGGEVEFREVGDEPGGARVVVLGCGDQHRVDVDADDVVSCRGELASDTTGPASGVEHPGPSCSHRVDEACFAREVVAGGGHRPEPFDVPRGVIRVLFGQVDPPVARHRVHANCQRCGCSCGCVAWASCRSTAASSGGVAGPYAAL